MKHTFGTKKNIYIYATNILIACAWLTMPVQVYIFPTFFLVWFLHVQKRRLIVFLLQLCIDKHDRGKKNSFLGCFHNINRHVQPINILHLPLRQWIMWHRMYWEGRSKVNSSTCVRKWHGVLDRCIRSCHNCDVCEERGSFFHQRDKPNDQLWREPLGAVRPIAGRMVMEG